MKFLTQENLCFLLLELISELHNFKLNNFKLNNNESKKAKWKKNNNNYIQNEINVNKIFALLLDLGKILILIIIPVYNL